MKLPVLPVVVALVFVAGFAAGRLSAPTPSSAATATAPMPSAAAPMAPSRPAEAPGDEGTVRGVVAELLQVPNYTYLRLTTAGGDEWAAVPTTSALTVGQGVAVTVSTRMQGFASKSLGRTFDSIVFGELAQGGAPAAKGAQLPPGHPPLDSAGAAKDPLARALDATRLAEPPLAMRVADVYSERDLLQGRPVRVTGTVSRVTNVNGQHFGHVKDGSGSAAEKNDDLVLISSTPLPVEQKVALQGVVVLNKDVGIGAPFPVALEGVTVAP